MKEEENEETEEETEEEELDKEQQERKGIEPLCSKKEKKGAFLFLLLFLAFLFCLLLLLFLFLSCSFLSHFFCFPASLQNMGASMTAVRPASHCQPPAIARPTFHSLCLAGCFFLALFLSSVMAQRLLGPATARAWRRQRHASRRPRWPEMSPPCPRTRASALQLMNAKLLNKTARRISAF